MTRLGRIALISSGAAILLVAIVVGAGVVMVRSGWLQEKIRVRVVAEAAKATGGKVEIGALRLDWKTLTAEMDNLVIHGTEPADAAPLLAVKRVTIGFKVISFLERQFNVARVETDGARVHLMIDADGSPNLPEPHIPFKTGVEKILALKIGKFDLANGLATVERVGGRKDFTPWNARGEKLAANVTYSKASARYDGTISAEPLDFVWNGGIRVSTQVTMAVSLEKNRLAVSSATVKTAQSQFELSNVLVSGFTAPLTTGQYKARVSLAEADNVFHLVNFQHSGIMSATGTFHFVSTTDYLVTATVSGSGIGYGNVPDMRVSGNVSATPGQVMLSGFRVHALGGDLQAEGEVVKLANFHIAGNFENLDARLVAAVGGVARLPYDGMLAGTLDASGKLQEFNLHQISAGATFEVSPAENSLPVQGEATATYDADADTIEFGRSRLEVRNTRAEFAGVLGQRLELNVQSRDLRDLAPLISPEKLPAKLTPQGGSVAFNGTVSGGLADLRVAGHAVIQNAIWEGQPVDSLTGDFTAAKTEVTLNNAALLSNSLRARITGSIGLKDWKAVDASAVNANVQLTNADMGRLLALAGEPRVPVSGTLNTRAQVTGTLGDPHATADLTLTRGQISGEPYDLVTGRAQYLNSGAQILTAVVDAGKKHLNASARFDHPNKLTFSLTSNVMALGEIALARKIEPNLGGTAQVKADGVVTVGGGKVDVLDLNADIKATALALGPRALGDAHLTAETKNGIMTAKLDSNFAKSAVHGDGTVTLTGDYPVAAKLTFSGLGLSGVAAVLRGANGDKDLNLDGSAAGEVTLNGSAKKPDLLTASIDVTQFELHPLVVTGDARNIPNLQLKNDGPVRATLARSVIRVESAHFQAPETDLALSGTVALNSQSPFDLHIDGRMNLALAQTYDADLTSSGELAVNAAVRGSYTKPDFSGRAELQKGDFHLKDFSNGLTNANGVMLFTGSKATIQSMSAESGGGKVDASGFAALTGGLLTFRLEARTKGVRVRYPEGVSTISDADVTLTGTSERSEASGTVTVRRVAINPRSDISNILAAAAQPMKTPEASAGFLGNLNLDVQIETAPDVAFETSVAQSVQADANLRLRGTAANPAVLGRINITQGELTFFGNKYIINQGSVSFFNPAKIDPVLNIDLETKARGVEVVITVTGPINALRASYRSDPPLQFSDIVALLATGRSPTDPTTGSTNTGESQNLQQLGATGLIGQALASPGGGPLQRFFGVSKVKIDPQATGITGSPQPRLTIEQQVTPDIVFTYITDISSTSTQLIRVEWDFNRKWAAIVTRDENGYVGVDFAYKKRFK